VSFDVLSVKIHAGFSAVGDWKKQSGKDVFRRRSVANMGCTAYFAYVGIREKKPLNGLSPFFLVGGIHGISSSTHVRFGDDCLMAGSGLVVGSK